MALSGHQDEEEEDEEGKGRGEAAIGIYCLPSNSQILSQAALILHEGDDGRNGDIGGGMSQPPYSTSPASRRGFQ